MTDKADKQKEQIEAFKRNLPRVVATAIEYTTSIVGEADLEEEVGEPLVNFSLPGVVSEAFYPHAPQLKRMARKDAYDLSGPRARSSAFKCDQDYMLYGIYYGYYLHERNGNQAKVNENILDW